MFWGFFRCGSLNGRVDVSEGHPPALLVPFWLLFIFSCSTTKRDGRGLKRAGGEIIPFTTFSVQGQASFEGGGYAGKNKVFPLFRKPPFLLRLLPHLLP